MHSGSDRLVKLGYWFLPTEVRAGVDPAKLVDPDWAAGERHILVRYLREGHQLGSYLGYSFCRFGCGVPNEQMGSCDLTDGVWMWPEGLWHYVASHGICLPDEFLVHARGNGFAIPLRMTEALAVFPDFNWENWALEKGALRDATSDPIVGTWVMDLAKCRWHPEPAPYTSWVSRIGWSPEGYRVTAGGVGTQGETIYSEMVWRFDGAESRIAGVRDGRTVQYQQIGDREFQFIVRVKDQIVCISRGTISADGKTRTNITTGTTPGQVFHHMEAYERR